MSGPRTLLPCPPPPHPLTPGPPFHAVPPRRVDDELHSDFLSTFPELAPLPAPAEGAGVSQDEYEKSLLPLTRMDEDEMKSRRGKEKWRNFIMKVSRRADWVMRC